MLSGHLREPQSAGQFTPGLPSASAGQFAAKMLGTSTDTVKAAPSSVSLQQERSTSQETFVYPAVTTPQCRPAFNSPDPKTPSLDAPPKPEDAMFTIQIGPAWSDLLSAVVKNNQWENLYVMDQWLKTYEIVSSDGTLDAKPELSDFPLYVMKKKENPERSESEVAKTSLEDESPAVSVSSVGPSPPAGCYQPRQNDVALPSPAAGPTPATEEKPVEKKVPQEQELDHPVPDESNPSKQNMYKDGSYWKNLIRD